MSLAAQVNSTWTGCNHWPGIMRIQSNTFVTPNCGCLRQDGSAESQAVYCSQLCFPQIIWSQLNKPLTAMGQPYNLEVISQVTHSMLNECLINTQNFGVTLRWLKCCQQRSRSRSEGTTRLPLCCTIRQVRLHHAPDCCCPAMLDVMLLTQSCCGDQIALNQVTCGTLGRCSNRKSFGSPASATCTAQAASAAVAISFCSVRYCHWHHIGSTFA